MKALGRAVAVAVLIVLTATLQLSVLSHFSWDGVVPDLVMLVVIVAALSRGPEYGAVIGFAAGLLVDLAPPADHIAGRWALAMLVVGWLTGLVRADSSLSPVSTLLTVAAGVFIGTSVFAISGIVLGEPGTTVSSALRVIPVAVGYDVLLAPLVIPLVGVVFRRLEPSPRW
jgi:rod shape-determining protein MreD